MRSTIVGKPRVRWACALLIALASLNARVHAAPDANADTLLLGNATSAVIDLLANDHDLAAHEMSVSIVSPPASSGIGVVNNGDGTITVSLAVGAPPNGHADFSYVVSDSDGSASAPIAVCWGNDPCAEANPDEEIACSGLCLQYGNQLIGTGGSLDLGSSNAPLDFTVSVINNLGFDLVVKASIASANGQVLQLTQGGVPITSSALTIPDGTQTQVSLRATFAPGVTTTNSLLLTDMSASPSAASPWTFAFSTKGPPNSCSGICIAYGGQQFSSGAAIDIGERPAASSATPLAITVINGTNHDVSLDAQILNGVPPALQLLQAGQPVSDLLLSIPANGQTPISAQVVFLPGPFAGNLIISDRASPPASSSPWQFQFGGRGDGQIVVTGYSDCSLEDVCLYLAGKRVASLLAGPASASVNLCATPGVICPFTTGVSQTIPAVLVYNGIATDGGTIPFQIVADSIIGIADANGVLVSHGAIGIGQTSPMTLAVNPQTAGSQTANIQFLIAGVGRLSAQLSLTANAVGSSCERCSIQLAGIPYANGASANLGTQPAGTSEVIDGLITNNSSVVATGTAIVTGHDNSYFQIDATNPFTLAPGASKPFHLTIYFQSGTTNAVLQVKDHDSLALDVSVGLTATGTGAIPPVPGFAACLPSSYVYCVFVGSDLAGAMPSNPGVQAIPSSAANYAFDFGQLTISNDTAGVPITIVNNGQNGAVSAAFVNPIGSLQVLSSIGGAPIPPAADGGTSLTVNPHVAQTVELRYTWQPPGGHTSTDPGLARIDLRFTGGFIVPLAFVSNCPGICLFDDYIETDVFGSNRGSKGFVGAPGTLPHHWLGLFMGKNNGYSQVSADFAPANGTTILPDGPTPFAFDISGTGILSVPVPSQTQGSYFELGYNIRFPAPSVTNVALKLIFTKQTGTGQSILGTYAFWHVTSENSPNPYPGCSSICLYSKQSNNSVQTDPSYIVAQLNQYLIPSYVTQNGVGQGVASYPWEIANNTSNWVPVSVSLAPIDPGISIAQVVDRNSGTVNTVTSDMFWLAPYRITPVPLSVLGGLSNSYSRLQIRSTAAVPVGALAIDLFNYSGSANADCATLCVQLAGAKVDTNATRTLPPTATPPASSPLTVVNGQLSAADFAVALLDNSGLILGSSSGVTLSGTNCIVALSTPQICRGHLAGKSAATMTLTASAGGSIAFRVVTTLTAFEHVMSIQACNGVCVFTGTSLATATAPIDFSRVAVGRSRSLPLQIVNGGDIAVHLGSAFVAAPFTLTGLASDITLAPHSITPATLVFQPVVKGTASATVSFSASQLQIPVVASGRAKMILPLGPKRSGKPVPTIRY